MTKRLISLVRLFFRSHTEIVAENLALRHQLIVLQRSIKRPRFTTRDRIFRVWLSRLWKNWRSSLLIVQPDMVVKWH
ncbi:MAG: hypothetical protein IIA64_08125 [Planctomycetes bacterium]|nr:hypothetical protein [Planctomycetota bacterium]